MVDAAGAGSKKAYQVKPWLQHFFLPKSNALLRHEIIFIPAFKVFLDSQV
jgi:hypothetical protein